MYPIIIYRNVFKSLNNATVSFNLKPSLLPQASMQLNNPITVTKSITQQQFCPLKSGGVSGCT
jgi:hypothetical protein